MAQEKDNGDLLFGASDRIELVATIIMALAAIATAWCAFQAGKWSGIQSIEFSNANSDRVESTRADTRAGQLTAIDVSVFIAFADAINSDRSEGLIEFGPGEPYQPVEGTLSGFWFERVRDEFRPAFDAWLEEFTLDRDQAPPTPFAMAEYVVTDAVEADLLLEEASVHRQAALDANQNGDNYVLTTVGFALVIFFAGISSKLAVQRNRWIAIGLGSVLFLGALVLVITLPIVPPFG